MMRVTNKMMTNNFLRNVNTNQNILRTLDNQLTTGKKFHRPSDNPFAVARSMQLYDQINANKQYNENIKDTANWLDTTDTALKQASDVFQKVHELLISAGNAGYSEKERLAIKDEINERINEFGQILNTSFDGKYIFGGYNGTEKPVKVDGGISYKNAKDVLVGDIKEWQKAEVTLKVDVNGTKKDIKITLPDSLDKKDALDLSKTINDKFNEAYKKELQAEVDAGRMTAEEMNEKVKDFSNTFQVKADNPQNKLVIVAKNGDIDLKIKKVGHAEEVINVPKTEVIDNGNASIDFSTDDAVKLEHMSGSLKTEISPGVVVDYSVSANEIFKFTNTKGEEKDLRDILNSIVNHLDGKDEEGNKIDSDEAVGKLLEQDLQDIKDAMDNILTVRSKVGARQNRMESAEEKNKDNNFNLTEILSKTEDIDFTEVTMQFAVAQTVYMASLQASAKILQPSLMDYLR